MWKGREKTIIHLDMDAYFASVEQRDHPIYQGRPVLVCHTDSVDGVFGVVAAASYEARPFGVKSGMSVFEAKKLCPKGIYLMGDYNKYLHNTKELVKICESFTDQVEVFSIDEMWLDVTETKNRFKEDAGRIAYRLQTEIKRKVGLSSSVGVGPNKLVAKMAGEFHKPGGITVIRPSDLPQILAPLPVKKLFGVGRKMKKHLDLIGVATIGDLAEVPDEYLKKRFGVVGLWLKQAAKGLGDDVLASGRGSTSLMVKSFGHSSALGSGEADIDKLCQILLGLCEGVTRRMRRGKYLGRTVTLRLCLARSFGFTRGHTLSGVSDMTETIYPVARALLLKEQPVLAEYPATLIGVSVSNLLFAEKQLSIFDLLDDRFVRLMTAVDKVKDKYGDRLITRAALLDWRRRYHGVEPSRLPKS